MSNITDRIIALLERNDFRCPATSDEEQIGNDHIVLQNGDIFDEMGIPEGPLQGSYDERDRCTESITVEIEHEYGEMGSLLSSYPVLLGTCARFHGYEYGEGYVYDEIMTRYSERKRLLNLAKECVAQESGIHSA